MQLISDHHKAVSFFQKALNSAKQQNLPMNVARSLSYLGNALAAVGSIDKAIEKHNESLRLCESSGNKKGAFYSRSNLIRVLNTKGETKKAAELTAENYKFASDSNDNQLLTAAFLEEAKMDLVLGNYLDAIDKLEQCRNLCIEMGDVVKLTNVLGSLGEVYVDTGEYDLAFKTFKETSEWAEKIGNTAIIAQCNGAIGSVMLNRGNYSEATVYFQKENEYAKTANLPPLIAQAMNGLGNYQMNSGNKDKALECWEESLRINQKIGNIDSIAVSLGQLSSFYRDVGNFGKSMEYLNQGIEHLLKTMNISTMIGLLVNKGLLLERMGQSRAAEQSFQQATTLVNKIGNKRLIALIYINAYVLAVKLGNPKVGLKFTTSYLDFIQRSGNVMAEGDTYAKIAFCYEQLNDYEKSESYYIKALEIGRNINATSLVIDSLNGLSVCNQERRNFDKAKMFLEEALKRSLAIKNIAAESGCYTNFSRLYILMQDWGKAFFYAEKAYNIASDIEYYNNMCIAGINAGICLKELGRKQEADVYFEKVKQLSIKLGNLDYLNRLRKSYDEENILSYLKKELAH